MILTRLVRQTRFFYTKTSSLRPRDEMPQFAMVETIMNSPSHIELLELLDSQFFQPHEHVCWLTLELGSRSRKQG
jgi:hypothetical protein